MPVYEVQKNGKTYEVEAPNPQAAAAGLARMETAPASRTAAAGSAGVLDTAKDVVIGAGKGAANTIFGLGKIVRDYTPIGRISDAIQPGAFDQRPSEITPSNTAQRVGFTGEQIAEFFIPTGSAGALSTFANAPRFVRGVEAAKAAGTTLAQTGSPTEAGISGAISAVLPGASTMRSLAGKLETSAEKSVAQALGATKEWAKDEAGRLAPQILERGVGGSRPAMLSRATEQVKQIGANIRAEVQAATQAGKTISGTEFVNAIADTRATLTMVNAAGKVRAIPGQEAAVRQLDRLAEFVATLGDDIPFDKAHTLRSAWDRIVSKAGLFGPKATASASDNAKAWAFREASDAMRELLGKGSATLKDLNQEFRFWKGLQNVLVATEKRTQAQGGGLTAAVTGATGAAAGFASGDSLSDRFEKALVGGVLGKQIVNVIQSPTFRTKAAGPLKQALAEALMSGSEGRVGSVLAQFSRLAPATVSALNPATAQ